MTVGELVTALQTRGWEVTTTTADQVEDLVQVNEKGLFKCVDGRLSDKPDQMHGPKTLGGVYAIVASRGQTDLQSLKGAIKEVSEAGFVPSVHGDDHNGAMGCGFFKLWVTGQLEGLDKPGYSAEEGTAVAIEAGATLEKLTGDHKEEVVMINLVKNKTLVPNETRFIVDAWITDEFDLDTAAYATRAAETVEKLKGPMKAVIILP